MYYLDLSGEWKCTPLGKPEMLVQVPGCFDTAMQEKDFAQEVVFTKTFVLDKALPHYRLCFGAVSYYCDVWLNGVKIGSHEGMWDSFYMDATAALQQGENTLKVAVTKPGYHDTDRFPLRQVLSGFLPDVLCTFGGLWEKPCLYGADSFFVQNHFGRGTAQGAYEVQVQFWAAEQGEYLLEGRLLDTDGKPAGELTRQPVQLQQGLHTLKIEGCLASPRLWSIDDPALYSYELTLIGPSQKETLRKAFGFRDISSEGSKILLNGLPVYPRGVLHWGYYDEIIIPRPPRQMIQDEIQACKAHGFNMIKHCLYIPSAEYFELADKMGMLLWIELPLWLPEPTPELENRIRREYPAIVNQISGHPSVVMMSLGCELNDSVDTAILEDMYHLVKKESGALVRDNSGSGECYGGHTVDYADFFDYHFYGELQNMENLMEAFTPGWRSHRPWLYGEFCDSDTMRDLAHVRASRGVQKLWWEQQNPVTNPISLLKPDFFAGEHDARMEDSGIRREFDVIQPLSIKHTMVHRKTTLEQTRSFPEISGYVITSIRDVPIATSGIFDDNMKNKFIPQEVAAFNNDVVLLPAWDLGREWIGADRISSRERYNFTSGKEYGLHILISNYSSGNIKNAKFSWQLINENGEIIVQAQDILPAEHSCGTVQEAYYLVFRLPETNQPQSYNLHVQLEWEGGHAANYWPVFVYPAPCILQEGIMVYDPCNLFGDMSRLFNQPEVICSPDSRALKQEKVLLTSLWTPEIHAFAKQGGRVMCVQRGKGPLPSKPVPFWREGMLRVYNHPVMDGCQPVNSQDDLRYFSLATDSAIDEAAMEEQGFVLNAPIMHRYDCRTWQRGSYMGEYTLGKGKVLVSTLRFEGGMGKQPLAMDKSPFACYLLQQVIRWLHG